MHQKASSYGLRLRVLFCFNYLQTRIIGATVFIGKKLMISNDYYSRSFIIEENIFCCCLAYLWALLFALHQKRCWPSLSRTWCPWCFQGAVDVRQFSRYIFVPGSLDDSCLQGCKTAECLRPACFIQTVYLNLFLNDVNETHCTCTGCALCQQPSKTDSFHCRILLHALSELLAHCFTLYSILWYLSYYRIRYYRIIEWCFLN